MHKSILIVDDCADMRLLLKTKLRTFGLTVDEAPNGMACLSQLQGKRYDLLFMDVQMPVLDGLDTTRLVRTRDSNSLHVTRIIGMSSLQMELECIDAGMDEFHVKPRLLEELPYLLKRWIGIDLTQIGEDSPVNTSESLETAIA